MCFSAEASFIGAAVLVTIGTLTLKKLSQRNQLLLALIPFIFALQQLAEGFLWLTTDSLEDYAHYGPFLRNSFLFIAVLIWPVWMPLSFFVAETKQSNQIWLAALVTGGLLYDLVVVYGMLFWWSFDSIWLEVFNHSIQYHLPLAEDYHYYTTSYYLLTILPTFFSSLKGTWISGILNLIGFAIAFSFFYVALVSVWCFFAAWVSLWVYVVISLNGSEKANA